ncbi:CheY-like chemotaxis protein [Rhodobium gokarnense]|uniref:CheY-like chemotaxis protein n=1 Tax=Rhodobium gokarnense TaxID=364296 RepID=A0ABT3HDJ0_9HYPH|nr:CheY-like chemotaxis protein [Rhodobium gokarnense]
MAATRDIMKLDLSNLRFLVVEDNTHMRRIIRMLLTGFGARDVVETEDGAAGLEAFQATSPDIVITDWVMPIIDGLELSRMLRNRETSTNPFVPIIMLTGHSEKKRVVEARDAGITEFLCKPISAKSLYLRIANTIVNPRPFIETRTYFGPDRRRAESSNYQGEERRQQEPTDHVVRPSLAS